MSELLDSATIERLVREAGNGSSNAWEELVKAHYGLIYTIAYSRLHDNEAAEDLVQDVFLRAWLQLKQLRTPSSFPYWIGRMARHLGSTWFRNQQRRSELLRLVEAKGNEMEQVKDSSPTPDQQAMDQEQQQQLHDAIQTLPPQEREATLLHFVEGLPKNAVAQHMDIHPATVGRMIDRATSRLKSDLGEDSDNRLSGLALQKQGPAATMASIAAVAALSPGAREAIIAAAAKGLPAIVSAQTSSSASTVSLGFFALLWQSLYSFIQGLFYMGTYKTAAASSVGIIAAAVGSLVFFQSSDSESSPSPISSVNVGSAISTAPQETVWQNINPYSVPGTEWKYVQLNEVELEGQMMTHAEIHGQCKVMSSSPDGSCVLQFQIDSLETLGDWGAQGEAVVGRTFQIERDPRGTITNLYAMEGPEIDQFQLLYILMGTAGTHLGPLEKSPLNMGDSNTTDFHFTSPFSDTNLITGNESYTFSGVDYGKDSRAVFDIELTTTIGGLPVSKDERTRTMVMLDSQTSIGKGTWTFDLNNPLNSQVVTTGVSPQSEMRIVIAVPGRDEPVSQPIPQPENMPMRTTITFSGV